MNTFAKLGKWMFAAPMAVFGFLHFGPLEFSLPYVPAWLPAPALWVYVAGAGLLLFALSAVLGRKDRLAGYLLALELLLFVALTHLPTLIGGDFAGLIATFRDLSMAGAAIMFAEAFARDRSLNLFGPKVPRND
ncbi:hypothetical protein [Lewinella sp. 4G2]|uniref:hypothetical protein n=1 Tax=Lewinella sp. 4G2 TaxID=1803372 RepID=UPI0007DFB7EC|nr:hypothetical protein [Lewinella sp. 4G2]OAV43825.1 hypothetical protein A3850_004620 [Lewinella sp. 4G2]